MKITDKHGQQWQLVSIAPEDLALLKEAHEYGQFSEHFNQPLAITLRKLIQRIAAAPEPELPEGLEPVEYKVRATAEWSGYCTEWKECSKEQYIDYIKTPVLHEWKYETRVFVLQSAALAELAKKDAEIAKLKTVPMRYRRLKFNAELQEQVQRQAALIEKCQSWLIKISRTESKAHTVLIVDEALEAINSQQSTHKELNHALS